MEIHESNDHDATFNARSVITPSPESSSDPDWKISPRKKKKNTETFGCVICLAVFGRRDHLRRHNKTVHCEEKGFVCHVCKLDFKGQKLLSTHIRDTHPGENRFICPECQYSANDLKALVSHRKIHALKHVCPHCDARFNRQDHMTRHVKSLHLKQHVTCEVCNQIFKRQDHLLRHMREQHGIDTKRLRQK